MSDVKETKICKHENYVRISLNVLWCKDCGACGLRISSNYTYEWELPNTRPAELQGLDEQALDGLHYQSACPIHGFKFIEMCDGDGHPASWSDFCSKCADENKKTELIGSKEYLCLRFGQPAEKKDKRTCENCGFVDCKCANPRSPKGEAMKLFLLIFLLLTTNAFADIKIINVEEYTRNHPMVICEFKGWDSSKEYDYWRDGIHYTKSAVIVYKCSDGQEIEEDGIKYI